MGVLSDHQIEALSTAARNDVPMIVPFSPQAPRSGVISYGVSSYGYDVRLGSRLRLARAHPRDPLGPIVLDPKRTSNDFVGEPIDPVYVPERGENYFVIPAHGFALGYSVERVHVPRDVMVICFAKSTYARCGLVVNVTPLEPEWEGHITLELSNTMRHPVRVYADEGIAQLVFFRADEVCRTSYADKKGVYQGQVNEAVLPRVR